MGWGKRTVQPDVHPVTGKTVIHVVTKGQKKSTKKLIPLTPAPRTKWQKLKRDAWG